MKTPLQRVAQLRSTLQKQAEVALAAAESDLVQAQTASEAMTAHTLAESMKTTVTAAALQLCESVSAAGRAVAVKAQRERDEKAIMAQQRTCEQRQVGILVDREMVRQRAAQNKREQQESDDRAQRRRGQR